MDNPIQLVRARLDGGKRWVKGTKHDGNGNACLVGAACSVGGDDVVDVIANVVTDQFPDRLNDANPLSPVECFNDHDDTTWADVALVLDKAEVRWDEVAS